MPAPARRPSGGGRPAPQRQRQTRARDEEGPIPVLAKAVRGVEAAVQRGRVTPATRSTFQAVALLVRELRGQLTNGGMNDAQRNAQMKRIEGIATILARTAARDSGLLALLTDDAALLSGTGSVLREMRVAAGMEAPRVSRTA